MQLVTLAKARGRLTEDVVETIDKIVGSTTNVELLSASWIIGRSDAIWVTEAPDDNSVITSS